MVEVSAGVPLGSYVPRASHMGFQTQAAAAVNVAWAKNTAVASIDLSAKLSFRGDILGSVSRVGLGPSSGVAISVPNSTLSTTSSDGGAFDLTAVPEGAFSLDFSLPPYVEHLPSVLSLPGGDGFVIGADGLVPLPMLELQRGLRLKADPAAYRYDAPNESRVIFAAAAGGPNACDLIGATPDGGTIVYATQASCAVVFTPDSSSFFFYTSASDLELMDVNGGAPRFITHGGSTIQFAAGGHLAAISTYLPVNPSALQIALYDLDAGALTVLSDTGIDVPDGIGQFSPSGRWLRWCDSPGGYSALGTLQLLDVRTGVAHPIDDGVYPSWVAMLPDESGVLYERQLVQSDLGALKLLRFDADGGVPPFDAGAVVTPRVVNFYALFSATGGELAYVDGQGISELLGYGVVTVLPLDGGTSTTYGLGFNLAPLPGGQAFTFNPVDPMLGQLLDAPFDGGALAVVITTASGPLVDYTPDGRYALYTGSDPFGLTTMKIVELATGAVQVVATNVAQEFVLSTDGAAALFVEQGDGGSPALMLLDVATNTSRQVGPDVQYAYSAGFSPDGTRLIWNDSHGGLFVEQRSGGAPVRLSQTAISQDFWFSPDSASVAWAEIDPATGTVVVKLGDAAGTQSVAALSYLYRSTPQSHFQQFPAWFGNNLLLAPRGGSPSPYQFQDGWYLLPAR